MRGGGCVLCACANELVSVTMNKKRIYTSGRENSHRRGFPQLRVFVAPLTFRRFALGSAGSAPGSGTSLSLDPDRDGAFAFAVAARSGTRGGEGGGASEDLVGS